MSDPNLVPGSEALVATALLAGTFVFSVFKLGGTLARPKSAWREERPPCGQHEDGRLIFTDPDGRIPAPARTRK